MSLKDQDNKASYPKWFRAFCIKIGVGWALAFADKGGEYHDGAIKPLGYFLAWVMFSTFLIWNLLALLLLIPITIVATLIYVVVPQKYKDKYFNLIE